MQYLDRLMVGIAGPTCAGKSTLERNLEIALGSQVSTLPFDDLTMELEYPGEIGASSWEDPRCYRWDDYRRHLKELRSGRPTRVRLNYWETAATGLYERVIEPRPIVVSVGFLALHDEIARAQFDFKLYLHIPEEEMIKKRAKRDQFHDPATDTLPYIMQHIVPATRQFVVPQREHADTEIDGLKTEQKILDEALAAIRDRQKADSS